MESAARRKLRRAQTIEVLTKKYRKVRKNIPVSILSERRFFGTCQKWHKTEIKLKSLILAQIERWRHALHMQVERQRGGNPGGEWRTGE